MPQMMPMNWLLLYIFFILLFMMFNLLNYYSHIPTSPSISEKIILIKISIWKW
uniref:ATP synthase complex subunit 8 n=1 Tax=Carbrunneria paramaxi TaxID=2093489 RepID=A0A2P1H9A2_9NEOP|nr:ATP synthase F0 subunit 8 [Carbrunneria paramaxi]